MREGFKEREEGLRGLQTIQHTSGGAVTAVTNGCAHCVEVSRPEHWVLDLPYLGKPVMQTRWMAGATPHKSG